MGRLSHPPQPPQPNDNPKAPDDYLTDDLTRSDLIYVLRNLRFRPPNSNKQRLTSIVIDRGVRDYLLRMLKAR